MVSDNNSLMTHQSKKKRTEDESLPDDTGKQPLQLQRRRVWRACESCRRKKIKCDGQEPTCSQCGASGSQCTWLQTKDRAALSRHYVQELEARLLHMETLFQQIAPVLEQITPSTSGGASASSLSSAAELLQSISSKEQSGTASSSQQSVWTGATPSTAIKVEDDVSEQFGQLALDEHGGMRWIGGSSTMSLIQSFRALTTSPLHRVSPMEEDPRAPGPSVNKLYFPASVFFGKVHALPGAEEAEFPDRDLADKLVEAYFTRFHYLLPVVDKPSFMRQYEDLMANKDDPVVARSQAAFTALVFAVFACAARLVDDPRLATSENLDDGGMGMVYYERALILHYISHASIQVSHVQCLILMSSFLCSVNCLPQAWLLVGQAVRSGQDLGLHRSPRRLYLTPIDKETRRKIWWGVYSLDRMLALALGRPLGVEDSDCDVELPVDVDDDYLQEYFSLGSQSSRQSLSLMAGYNALTGLYRIAGRVLREVYAIENCKESLEPEKKAELQRTVESLDRELTQWCDNLPVEFKSEPVNEKQVSMGAVLCSHYYSVLTTLHRNFLPVKKDQPAAPKSTAKAVSSARSCIRLAPSIKNVVAPSHHLAFFIQHLFSSAVIILLYAMHSPDPRAASAAMEEGRSCLGALESWEGYWPGARKCRELLTDLANTADEAIKASGDHGSNAPLNAAPPHSNMERRRSVTISTATTPGPGRSGKSKPRKISRSRDPYSRRPPVASVMRAESQRARSTSRKRVHDETDAVDTSNPLASYNMFSSPVPARANLSPHSSPSSNSHPSPAMSSLDPPGGHDQSPRLVGGPQYNSYNGAPLSPLHVPTQNQYDYGNYQSPLAQSSSNQWTSNSGEPSGLDIYPTGSQQYSTNFHGEPLSAVDSNYMGYGGASDMGGNFTALSTTPPTASFDAPGLPFRGLDFIQNYNRGGYSVGGDQDSLWQSFDAGAFGYDPELPFALPDMPNDVHDGQQHQQQHQQ